MNALRSVRSYVIVTGTRQKRSVRWWSPGQVSRPVGWHAERARGWESSRRLNPVSASLRRACWSVDTGGGSGLFVNSAKDGGVLARPADEGWRRTYRSAHLPPVQVRFRIRERTVPEPGPDEDPLVRKHSQRHGLSGGEIRRASRYWQWYSAGDCSQVRRHGKATCSEESHSSLTGEKCQACSIMVWGLF